MELIVRLQNPQTADSAHLKIQNIDPSRVSRMIQDGHTRLETFVSGLVSEKLPTKFYNYDVVDWAFRDEMVRHPIKMEGFVFIEFLIWVLILGAVLFSIFGGPYTCAAKWDDSGFNSRYAYFSGCQISFPENPTRWIPEENYREQ